MQHAISENRKHQMSRFVYRQIQTMQILRNPCIITIQHQLYGKENHRNHKQWSERNKMRTPSVLGYRKNGTTTGHDPGSSRRNDDGVLCFTVTRFSWTESVGFCFYFSIVLKYPKNLSHAQSFHKFRFVIIYNTGIYNAFFSEFCQSFFSKFLFMTNYCSLLLLDIRYV